MVVKPGETEIVEDPVTSPLARVVLPETSTSPAPPPPPKLPKPPPPPPPTTIASTFATPFGMVQVVLPIKVRVQ
jgi:hypothetical protein